MNLRATGTALTGVAVFVVLVSFILLAGSHPPAADTAMHGWLAAHRTHVLTRVARDVTDSAGSPIGYLVLAAIAVSAGVLGTGTRHRLRLGLTVVAVAAVGIALRQGLVQAIGRARPPRSDWAATAAGFSFPSGHSTSAALAAGLLGIIVWHTVRSRLVRVLTTAFCIAYALAVGLTRAYLGVHWPTDVLGGWALATVVLAAGHPLLTRSRS